MQRTAEEIKFPIARLVHLSQKIYDKLKTGLANVDEILKHEVVSSEIIGLALETQDLFNKTISEDPNQEVLKIHFNHNI